MKDGFIYILSNKYRTVLYIGVTHDLKQRLYEHKSGEGSVFTKKYKTKYLIYYEYFENIVDAIDREKQLKNWHREWKFNLIKSVNPDLKNLEEEIY